MQLRDAAYGASAIGWRLGLAPAWSEAEESRHNNCCRVVAIDTFK